MARVLVHLPVCINAARKWMTHIPCLWSVCGSFWLVLKNWMTFKWQWVNQNCNCNQTRTIVCTINKMHCRCSRRTLQQYFLRPLLRRKKTGSGYNSCISFWLGNILLCCCCTVFGSNSMQHHRNLFAWWNSRIHKATCHILETIEVDNKC